jgi:nucleoside phosphorylase
LSRYSDALVVVPLEEEFETVLGFFDYVEDLSTDTLIRFAVCPRGGKLPILLVKQQKMGKTANMEAIADCLKDFDFGLLMCVGIAAGLSGDVAIGDVCYSTDLADVLDNIKISAGQSKKRELQLSPTFFETDRELIVQLNFRSTRSPM